MMTDSRLGQHAQTTQPSLRCSPVGILIFYPRQWNSLQLPHFLEGDKNMVAAMSQSIEGILGWG